MRAQPLYLNKFEYSPALIFPKFSVLIISSLIKKKKVYQREFLQETSVTTEKIRDMSTGKNGKNKR